MKAFEQCIAFTQEAVQVFKIHAPFVIKTSLDKPSKKWMHRLLLLPLSDALAQ